MLLHGRWREAMLIECLIGRELRRSCNPDMINSTRKYGDPDQAVGWEGTVKVSGSPMRFGKSISYVDKKHLPNLP